jgi:hypothetical protein
MKKIIYLLSLLFSIILVSTVYAQSDPYDDWDLGYMFVNSRSGLRMRNSPSLDGEIITVLQYGKEVIIDKKTAIRASIDGIDDYWYKTDTDEDGWVFGGYLTDKFIDNPIIGGWRLVPKSQYFWMFKSDNTFSTGLKETSSVFWGKYRIEGTVLTLITTGFGMKGDFEGSEYITERLNIKFLDSDNIIISNFSEDSYEMLEFGRREMRLKRNNSMY